MHYFFFFNDTATTEIYTLSLHDALPIFRTGEVGGQRQADPVLVTVGAAAERAQLLDDRGGAGVLPDDGVVDRLAGVLVPDRKSTRLNSSHANISYAVFCLKKKKKKTKRL